MSLDAFDFHLPEELIALRPAVPRDSARLLVVKASGTLVDASVADLPDFLHAGDLMVFNETRVLAAALQGVRRARDESGRDVQVDLNLIEAIGDGRWKALARPGRRLRPGDVIEVAGAPGVEITGQDEEGSFEVRLLTEGEAESTWLDRVGAMPIPPYIARKRAADVKDRDDYQTTFAKGEAKSVAAPTAGLHFTPELLDRIDARGVRREFVRLDVGAGTFANLKDEQLASGRLHAEHCEVSAEVAAAANAARAAGGRLIPVGTTALRTLESACDSDGQIRPISGTTDIFIKPGRKVLAADVMMTNFHLPRSSLFMLVCAMMGTDVMQAAYAHAIRERYRFFSYGDACLLLPHE